MFLTFWDALSRIFFLALQVVNSGSFPHPLSAAKEREYLVAYHEHGDVEARNKLVEHNLRLVAHIIKKYYSSVRDQDDLISIGTIGLIKSVNTFRADKNIKLATYASRCIENEILMYLRRKSSRQGEISIDEPLNVDWDGNELLLSDILGSDEESISYELEQREERQMVRLPIHIREHVTAPRRSPLTD